MELVATFCGNCNCGCPQLFIDRTAPAERRVVLTDDFGQRIEMSAEQFASFIEQARGEQLYHVAAS
jgi:hypothetical protein